MLGPAGPLQAATDRTPAALGQRSAALGFALRTGAAMLPLAGTIVLAIAALPLYRAREARRAAIAPPAHLVRSGVHGLAAEVPGQRLQVAFGRSGATLHGGALRVSLGLRAIGYGSALDRAPSVAPTIRAGRASYTRPGLIEWYTNVPGGLEQGFALTRAPRRHGAEPLTLAIALSGNAHAALSENAQSVSLARAGAPSLRYGELHATDARGRSLHSWLALGSGAVLLRVDARGARYPLTIDPLVQHQQGETISGGAEESQAGVFGASLALNGDGTTALVGSPHNDGAAFVLTRSGSAWVQHAAKLLGRKENVRDGSEPCIEETIVIGGEITNVEEGCGFGVSVALSADGNTALIGNSRECPANFKPRTCNELGAAYVFERTFAPGGETWTQRALLRAGGEGGGEHFGASVALSADGKTALVGAPGAGGGTGAAWVFTRSSSGWNQLGAKLKPSNEQEQGRFGKAVALSADGTQALIGAPGNAHNAGAAWSFTRGEGAWAQGQELTGAGSGEPHFGHSVALSSHAELALIGAFGDTAAQGAVWSFLGTGAGTWAPGERLSAADEIDKGMFGYSVALTGNASLALVGGPGDHLNSGAAWVFTRSGAGWAAQHQKLFACPPSPEPCREFGKASFGYGLALSSDGSSALIGGPSESDKLGAVWPYAQGGEGEGQKEGEESGGNAPRVTQVVPSQGPSSGGAEVTISGLHLGEVTAMEFGGVPVAAGSFHFNAERKTITAVAPRHAAGTVHVVVLIKNAASEQTAKDQFTYVDVGGAGQGETPSGVSGSTGAGGALGSGPTGSASSTCRPTLLSRAIKVSSKGRTSLKLMLSGAGACRGKLTLSVKIKRPHARATVRTIATGGFSSAAGRTAVLTLALNKLGRKLLHDAHGHLGANLAIVRVFPVPVQARSASVRLTLQRTHRATAPKH